MRISNWSSYVCSPDLDTLLYAGVVEGPAVHEFACRRNDSASVSVLDREFLNIILLVILRVAIPRRAAFVGITIVSGIDHTPINARVDALCVREGLNANINGANDRSEEHTSELQSLMRSSYAVFCLKKKKIKQMSHCDKSREINSKHKHKNKNDLYTTTNYNNQ